MDYIKGMNRDQIILFPEAIDDYISEDNQIKFVDAFVDSLDLKNLGFKYSDLKETGRPPYDPADMLKLYIYGYLNRLRTSRSLEKEAGRNVELMWLLKKLVPDHKTIANFRKDNLEAIKGTCKEFTLVCKKLDLFGAELIAVDGSKFRAQNAKKKSFTKAKLEKTIKVIDEKVESYIADLEENDALEADFQNPDAAGLREKIASLTTRKEEHTKLLNEMDAEGKTEISLTDPDSRLMMNSQRVEVCYNTQIAVDSKHKLIVEHNVINSPADQGNLTSISKRARETFGAGHLEVLADKGYHDPKDIKACSDAGMIPLIPRPKRSRPKIQGHFNKWQFIYEKENDVYICPAGETLYFEKTIKARNKIMRFYSTSACSGCPLKHRCTQNKKGRSIVRWEHEAVLENMWAILAANPEKLRMRQWIVEHPFGTIKRSFDQGYMLLKGIDKVRTEFSLTVLAYNMKRAIQIVGVKGLVAELGSG